MTSQLADGESAQVAGSGASVYTLKNSGGVYSCSCPAWRNQSIGIEKRTCKHLRRYLGDEAETQRVGDAALTGRPAKPKRVTEPGEAPAADDEEGPPLLLAHKWENDVDLTGWWISEKLDGVRAYWDGTQFISRLGNRFFAPKWFVKDFPKTPLDGELWGGRKLFQRTVGIVKRQDESELWKELKYMVFDAPSHGGEFEARMAFIESTLERLNIAWLTAHTHTRVENTEALKAELARVEALGGEGLMLRKPKSHYEAGRSNTLLKVKSFFDAEARVIGHVAGLGRHKGRLGAVLAELEDGTQFNVGTGFSDAEREAPPAIGSLITVRYQELSNTGVPRFPSYVGVRIDGTFKPKPRPGPHSEAVRGGDSGASTGSARTVAPATGARYFEFVDGGSSKFWEIRVEGTRYFTRYGKIGSSGQTTVKEADSEERAQGEAMKLVSEKTKKGYLEKERRA